MNGTSDALHVQADAIAPPTRDDEQWGWYLYGITRGESRTSADVLAEVETTAEDEGPAQAIASAGLLAIVRRVPVADFYPEVLRARADDPAWVEARARRHNAVLETVHRRRTILPAKFGSVYPHAEDVRAALQDEREALLAGLDRLDGCDEWGVHLYADMTTIRRRADAEQESVQRLRRDLASASPGRAYFLQRKLAEEQAKAADDLLGDLVGRAYEHIARQARAGQVTRQVSGSRVNLQGESAEILRAAFLVPHASADAFIEDVRQFSESQPGLWCEYSGPWPPYSFAVQIEEE